MPGFAPWKKISNNENSLLFKFVQDNGLFFFATDLKTIWHNHMTEKEFINLILECNKLIKEMDPKAMTTLALEVLTNSEMQSQLNFSLDELQNLTIKISSKQAIERCGLLIKLTMKLLKGDADLFYRHLTLPFLETINDLKASETVLIDQIAKKDQEIEEYTLVGAKLLIDHLKTEKFEKEVHKSTHSKLAETINLTCNELQSVIQNKPLSFTQMNMKTEILSQTSLQDNSDSNSCSAQIKNRDEVLNPRNSSDYTDAKINVKNEINSQITIQAKKVKKRGLNL